MRLALTLAFSIAMFATGFYLATAIEEPGSAVAALTGIVSIYSSFLVAIATFVLVVEARKTREAQTAPDVSVSFTQPNSVGAMFIVIKNDGAGTARNIQFSIAGDLTTYYGRLLSETSYIKQGIGYLVPGQQIRSFLISAEGLKQQPPGAGVLTISADYKSENGKRYKKEFFNDLSTARHMSATDQPIEKIGAELERLRRIAAKLVEK